METSLKIQAGIYLNQPTQNELKRQYNSEVPTCTDDTKFLRIVRNRADCEKASKDLNIVSKQAIRHC